MNAYPDEYIVHNLPLVILTGLEPSSSPETPFGEKSYEFLGDGGFRIRAELPALRNALTSDLRNALLAHDQSKASWRPNSTDKTQQPQAFKIRSVGRAYTFPPRKAHPPPHSPRLRPANDNGVSPPPLVLHSTLSPLSPSSPLYPDGIISPLWITKHQYRLPSALVSFYSLVSSTTTASLEDDKIKSEVNNIRSLITSTNYKTKFVLVLVADGLIENTQLEERLVNIRRGTSFDSKALYFLPSTSSVTELRDFAKVLFATLHPTCIEYYRDLSKHARRKRNRNSVPAPTIVAAHPPLTLHGWNVRYEFKLGIFAETRQEFDAAARNYEQAYEALFHTEMIDSIPAWSARFNEARMLADILALRIIRCLLWSDQTTSAVRSWVRHRDRTRDLVDRRGRGTDNYGWEAWLSIWSKVMVDLLEKAETFPAAHSRLPPGSSLPVYISSEKLAATSARQTPWDFLHHEGYWLNIVHEHIRKRRQAAQSIPGVSDTVIKGMGMPKMGEYVYDTYLTPDPSIEALLFGRGGDNYARRICDTIDEAMVSFKAREQHRMVDQLHYVQAAELSSMEQRTAVSQKLRPLWQAAKSREQGWQLLLAKLASLLFEAATNLQDHELCLFLAWELNVLNSECGEASNTTSTIATALDLDMLTPSLVSNFAFASESGHVGEPIDVQFSIKLLAPSLSNGLRIVEVKIAFDGSFSPILLKAEESDVSAMTNASDALFETVVSEVMVDTSSSAKRLSIGGGSYWSGRADFALNQHKYTVYGFKVIPKDAGFASVASITTLLSNGHQELTVSSTSTEPVSPQWWELRNGQIISRDFGMHRNVSSLNVLSKPPKVDINVTNLASMYYTNEAILLEIEVHNAEDAAVDGVLQAQFIGPKQDGVLLFWQHDESVASKTEDDNDATVSIVTSIGSLDRAASTKFTAVVSGINDSVDYELELKFSYTMGSDKLSTLIKQVVVDLPVIRPFEANALFQPRLHSDQWPDFFEAPPPTDLKKPTGLKQSFDVRVDLASFASEPLITHALELIPGRLTGQAVSASRPVVFKQTEITRTKHLQISNEETKQFNLQLEVQKLKLGDRAPVTADYALEITWSRTSSLEHTNKSSILLPKLLAPMSEPRVLLEVTKEESLAGTYSLHYTIENPSMHFLTFSVSLESGEGFAFSGPKMKSISLVPISRCTVSYHVLMQRSKDWVNIQMTVLDAFFGQTLKVIPASEGVRVDKQGHVQVWSDELAATE